MVYSRFINRNGRLVGPYLYKSVRTGNKVIGKYMGRVYYNSVGVSIGHTLETYKPPRRYSTARKIYESSTGRKFPLKKVIVDTKGKYLEPRYNASVDTRIGVAIVAPRLPKPEKTKAILEEAMHMDGHGEKTAEKTAIRMMHSKWRNLPTKELNRLRGRDKGGRPLRYHSVPLYEDDKQYMNIFTGGTMSGAEANEFARAKELGYGSVAEMRRINKMAVRHSLAVKHSVLPTKREGSSLQSTSDKDPSSMLDRFSLDKLKQDVDFVELMSFRAKDAEGKDVTLRRESRDNIARFYNAAKEEEAHFIGQSHPHLPQNTEKLKTLLSTLDKSLKRADGEIITRAEAPNRRDAYNTYDDRDTQRIFSFKDKPWMKHSAKKAKR